MLLALVLAAAPVSHYRITPDLARGTLAVELRIEHWDGARLCVDMEDAAAAIEGLERDGEDCFVRSESPTRYVVNLKRLRRIRSDPDYATDLGPAWIFHDSAVLLHADQAPGELHVRFVLPPGTSVAAPWPRDRDGAYLVTFEQFDAGAYVVVGALRTLPLIDLGSFSARVTVVNEEKQASDAQLREWVKAALEGEKRFYRGSPTKGTLPLHVVLAAGPGDDPGVFGSVLRRADPSVLLIYGARATSGFAADWVATHELFHLGNPPTNGRFPWFTEGFTTYYTELIRARRGVRTQAATWGNLASSARDYCQPGGRSLLERSHGGGWGWMQMYWGGACLALRLDVEIRTRSEGQRSLDDVLRAMRDGPELDEAGVIGVLDEASGGLASRHLHERRALPMDHLLDQLGVGEVRDDEAALRDDAPLSSVRRQLTRWADEGP